MFPGASLEYFRGAGIPDEGPGLGRGNWKYPERIQRNENGDQKKKPDRQAARLRETAVRNELSIHGIS